MKTQTLAKLIAGLGLLLTLGAIVQSAKAEPFFDVTIGFEWQHVNAGEPGLEFNIYPVSCPGTWSADGENFICDQPLERGTQFGPYQTTSGTVTTQIDAASPSYFAATAFIVIDGATYESDLSSAALVNILSAIPLAPYGLKPIGAQDCTVTSSGSISWQCKIESP